jgi:threonyl-tRNA synthetase
MSPGSAFFLPHGMIIYNALHSYIREEYWNRGYKEVNSPNMYNSALWKQSGHWQHYHEDMFTFRVEKEEWALKPMNCPGHCLLLATETAATVSCLCALPTSVSFTVTRHQVRSPV